MELPSPPAISAIVRRYSSLVARLQGDLGERPMVLPNNEFFPDAFAGDQVSLQRLVGRMQGYAGIEDVPLEVKLVNADNPPISSASCSSGACMLPSSGPSDLERLIDHGDHWTLQIPEPEIRHSVVMTTNVARSLSFMFLVETRGEDEVIDPPLDVTADLAAVALGFGALLLQGSYIYAKSCGGPSIASVTKLSCGELSVAFSLFLARGDHALKKALSELDVTQRALLKEASGLILYNRVLVKALKNDPHVLASGHFDLHEPRPWISRVFSRRTSSNPPPPPSPEDIRDSADLEEFEDMLIDMPPASSAARPSQPPAARDDELKALVEQELKAAPPSNPHRAAE